MFSNARQSDFTCCAYNSLTDSRLDFHSGICDAQMFIAAVYNSSPVLSVMSLDVEDAAKMFCSVCVAPSHASKLRLRDFTDLVDVTFFSPAFNDSTTFADIFIAASASSPISSCSTPTVAIWYDNSSVFSISTNALFNSSFLSEHTHLPPFALFSIQKESIQPLYFSWHVLSIKTFCDALATDVPVFMIFCVVPARAATVFCGVLFAVVAVGLALRADVVREPVVARGAVRAPVAARAAVCLVCNCWFVFVCVRPVRRATAPIVLSHKRTDNNSDNKTLFLI